MNRLKELRIKHNMTQEDMGEVLGIGKSTVCKYESGKVALTQKAIDKLCNLFNVASDYLLGRSDESGVSIDEDIASPDFVGIPLLGSVHAGLPMLAQENIEDYIPQSASSMDGGDYFYMRVVGDCMTGDYIPEGALVLVRQQPRVQNDEIAVVRVEDEVVLRHVRLVGGQLVLVPSNTSYEPLIITGGDVQIIGKVCEVRFQV